MKEDQKPDKSSPTGTQTVCPTNTLTDEPEQSDAFSGPHQRIADAIAELIQPPDAKGISIGIEGSWGSGKSTVARLLTRKLQNNKNIAVITFDAWAHEGDPLRRTFLETIIRKLQYLRWVNRSYWNNRIEQLANRREVVETKDSLKITPSGKMLAFMLLLVPIGGAFINAALRENVTLSTWPPGFKFGVLFSIGLVLTFIPLLVLLSKVKNEPDILGVLFNKGPTQKTTETSKTVNPTSIEFEDNFRKLFKHALGRPKNQQKRIVLILDNLDRVDAEDALSIWATLQTFLQHKGTARPSWHERVWLLVLYDLGGLRQLWEKSDNNNETKTAVSFIDKSFQVRFEVPALVQSDWRKFLTAQLKDAFRKHTDPRHHHQVYRVLNIWFAERSKLDAEKKPRTLTIRELKLFVNQIGSLHRQWAGSDPATDTFSLALIAYYVLLRRHGEDVIQLLFDPKFPPQDYRELLGSKIREELAALAFNVEVAVAQQLLFSDKINNALTNSSDDELKDVEKLLPKGGFWEVFEPNATKWASSETLKIADAALAIEKSGILSAADPAVSSVTKSFSDRVPAVTAWSPMDTNRAEGIAILLKWKHELQDTAEEYEQFTQALSRSIALGLLHVDQKLSVKDWLVCLDLMLKNLEATTKQKSLTTIVETLSSRLRKEGEEALPSPQFELVLEVLSELQNDSQIGTAAGKELTELVDSGVIAAHATPGLQTSKDKAWLLYVTIRYGSSLKDSPLITKKEIIDVYDRSLIESFVPIVQRFHQTSYLFEVPGMVPDLMPLVRGSLKIALNNPDANEWFNADAIERLQFIFKELAPNEEEESVLANLLSERSTEFINEIMLRDFQPSNPHLYLFLLKIATEQKDAFASWCVNGLRSVQSYDDSDIWGKNSLVSLALYLAGMNAQVDLGEKYSQELKNNLESRPIQDLPDPERSGDENIAALIGPLESQSRQTFLEFLCDRIKRDETPSYFFKIFRLELKSQLLHSSYGGKVVAILPKILTSHYQVGLEWLKETLSEAGEHLESKYSNEAAWAEFKRAVRRALISERFNIERYPLVKSIASILNVKLPSNGAITFATPDYRSINTVDPTSLETAILIKDPFPGYEVLSDPSWSPGGDKLAYIGATDSSAGPKLFVFDSTRNGSTLITGSTRNKGRPSWSPDGKTLAFVRDNELDIDIYTINLETREERGLTKASRDNECPSWSPDGTRLVFHRIETEGVRIFMMNADGSNQKFITERAKDYDPSWSPDGTRIAFARRAQAVSENGIYLINPDGSDLKQLIQENDARAPTWSPDGTKLLYQVGHGLEARIYQVDAEGQNKKEVTKGIGPSWQPLVDDGPSQPSESPIESTVTVDSTASPPS